MKQTRKIIISEKVFTAKDLQRLAQIFEKQRTLTSHANNHINISYQIMFSNNTSLETDSPTLFGGWNH